MAKKETQEPCAGGAVPGPGQRSCVGTQTKITDKSFGRETRVSRFIPHGAFTFTSPNAVPPLERGTACVRVTVEAVRKKDTKTQRRGELYQKKVDLPYACPTGTKFLEERGRCSDGSEPKPHVSCGARGKPCSTVRQTCPVQFVFKNGEPHLRFCGERGKPAPLVKVTDPSQAQKLAQEACNRWEKTAKRYPEGTQGPLNPKTGRHADWSGRLKTPGKYTRDVYKAPLGRWGR